jgi:hypothetical protein
MRTTTSRLYETGHASCPADSPVSARWAHDEMFDSLVRELVQERAASVELASTARREMADIKKEEESVSKAIESRAREDRAAFARTIEDAYERSAGRDVEIPYDSADPDQERQAEIILRHLVSLGYAEVRTEEQPDGHEIYRIRLFWDKLRRWHEPGD